MTERAQQLHAAADRQITALIDLASALDQDMLRRPCSGREKLGDGTVGASAQHTADNYQRIAAFVETSDRMSAGDEPRDHDGHRGQYAADSVDLAGLVAQLATTRTALRHIAELRDDQLEEIPPAGSLRFCDGQRTLEQVLTSLLTHQAHQLDALGAATA